MLVGCEDFKIIFLTYLTQESAFGEWEVQSLKKKKKIVWGSLCGASFFVCVGLESTFRASVPWVQCSFESSLSGCCCWSWKNQPFHLCGNLLLCTVTWGRPHCLPWLQMSSSLAGWVLDIHDQWLTDSGLRWCNFSQRVFQIGITR